MSTDGDMVLDLLECLEVQDGPGRLQQLALLQAHVDGNGLQEDLLQPVLDSLSQLMKDNNHKVCQKAIQVLHMVVQKHGTALASYSSWFLPVLVERLGDVKQQVRDAVAAALQAILSSWGLQTVLPMLTSAWAHRNPRVKQGTLQVVTDAITMLPIALSLPATWLQLVLQPAAKLLDDPNSGVREAAMVCIEELHQQLGSTVLERLEDLHAKPAQLKQLQERFNNLAANSEAVQDFPLFQAVTVETVVRRPGSVTSRSDCSSQSADAESSIAATNAYSPLKVAISHSQASTPALLERASSSTDLKKGLIAALPKASVRRGGFKDSGGLTAAGELPEAPPIWVESGRELKAEIEKLVVALDEKQEWTKRVEALLRVESLVRGGAAGLEGFLEMLKPLRQPLTVQLNDRRSAVSKQACRILGLLSAALGARFDMYALYFLPIIFKITVITVQVMAEAADLCCHTLVHHCPSPRLLKPIADAVCTDRNAKLRQCCAKYMLQVLEDWDMETCVKGLDLVEATIRSAAQDSSSETRSIGRSMYAAYVRAMPDKGLAFLRRMDTGLQEKLSQATLTYIQGQYQPLVADQQPILSKVALPAAYTLPLPPSPTPPSRPPSGRSIHSRSGTVLEEASFSQAPSHTAPAKRSSRKSVGGNALRVLSGATQNAASDSAEAVRAPQRSALSARRISCMPPPAPLTASRGPQRDPSAPTPTPACSNGGYSAKRVALQEQAAVPGMPSLEAAQQLQHGQSHQLQHAHATYYEAVEPLPGAANDSSAPAETSGQSHLVAFDGAGLTAGSVLTMALSAGSDWKAKLDMFMAMQQLLQQANGPAWSDFAGCSEKLVQIMLEHIGDPHFKVAHAALDAVQACLQHHASMLEASLDRLLPLLAQRIIDPKEAIRNAAVGCLECSLELYPVELCLPQLARSLDTVKAAKGRTALLEVFTGNCGQAVTTAAALPALRVWVGRVATLVGDRNAEVRRAACQALHLVYTRMDGPTLLTHVAHASPPDQMTLRRVLTPMLPNLDAQLAPYSRTRAGQSAHRPHTAPSASSMPSALVGPFEEQTPTDGSSTALVQDQNDRESARFIPPPLISEFSLSSVNQAQGLQGASIQDGLTGLHSEHSWQDNASKDHQPHAQQTKVSEVKARHIRVSISTVGSIKNSVFTSTQHQPTVQSEALQPFQMPQDGHVTGTLSPTASVSASAYHEEEDLLLSQAADVHPASHFTRSGQAAQLDAPLHEGNVLQDITVTGLLQNKANGRVFQSRSSGRSSLSPGTAQNRALPNTLTDITAQGRAVPNSPDRQGKALPSPAALRTSGDAQPVVQSAEAIQEAAVLDAVQQVHQAEGEAVLPSLQALQLQIATARDAVLQGCLSQVVSALLPSLTDSSWQAKQAAIAGIKGLASQGPALRLWVPALVPALLEMACHARPEVCMAADDCLASLLPQQPAAVCLTLLKANLPAQGTVNIPACRHTALIQASVKNIGRVVQRMPSAELLPELQSPDLLPGLFEAFDHHSADVRKAVTMCLMYMWQVMGDDLKPFLAGLRVSKIKLVTAYVEQAQSQQRRSQGVTSVN
ncbi:hypothetical protein WJX77_005003 [Trebouxia sp. C0004]